MMPNRPLLTTHKIVFTCAAIVFGVPRVLSIYNGGSLSKAFSALAVAFGIAGTILYFCLEKAMDRLKSDRLKWYFEEDFPFMVLHLVREIVSRIRSRYRAYLNSRRTRSGGQGDSIPLDCLDQVVIEGSGGDAHASAERPIFHSYVEPAQVDQPEPSIPHHTPVHATPAPSFNETSDSHTMLSGRQSNANPLALASISCGGSQPRPAEGIVDIDRTVQGNINGTTDDDGSLDISSVSRGSADITSMPFPSRVPVLRNGPRVTGIADEDGNTDIFSTSTGILPRRGFLTESDDISPNPQISATSHLPQSHFTFQIVPNDAAVVRGGRNPLPCAPCRASRLRCDQAGGTPCRRCKEKGIECIVSNLTGRRMNARRDSVVEI